MRCRLVGVAGAQAHTMSACEFWQEFTNRLESLRNKMLFVKVPIKNKGFSPCNFLVGHHPNVGLFASASGGATNNVAARFDGIVGFGGTTSSQAGIQAKNTSWGVGPTLVIGDASSNGGGNGGVQVGSFILSATGTSDTAAVAYAQAASSHGITFGSTTLVGWSSNSSGSGTTLRDSRDTALVRSAAKTVRVSDGSTGAGTFSVVAVTPAQITADQNNYAPGVGWFHRWSSDASRNITGLTAGVDGQVIEIWNVGSQNIVLQNQNASSTAANRFLTSTGADLTLTADKCAEGRYDNTTQRWRVRLCN